MKTSVLKPGLLVSLKSAVRGGVSYQRVDLETDHTDETGARRARWETARTIPDADEFERATVARGKARALVSAVCCASSFGLLCPNSRESDLAAAIEAARVIAEDHNKTAALTHVSVYVLVGRIAQDDAEASSAIASDIRDMLEDMQRGIAAADPELIRKAANEARALNGMLSADVSGKVDAAITEARRAARVITARVTKAGEIAATVVAECSTAALAAARFGLLDMEGAEATPEAPVARAIDLDPTPAAPSVQAAPVSLPYALEV